MKLRGRHWLGLWLLLFLGAAALVVTRQRAAILTAGRLAELREQRQSLEAVRSFGPDFILLDLGLSSR
ncbi:MAG TPA: hypothetical protein VJK71_06125, partial [Gemmatimonadales bacterium]|nr:hypothetical protein [Gemmatimonadales bacterium]